MGTTLGKLPTSHDVKAEVESFGPSYEKYGTIAVNEGIDGEMILELTESDLVELGVTSSLHRKKLLLRIAAFVASVASTGGGGAGGGGTPSSPMPTQFPKGIALVMHITYSREDSELLVRIQDAARKAKWEISGIMSNQGKEWFEAWKIALHKSHGVCVFFTEGNAKVLNNQGVGYTDKFATRMKSLGDEAPLYMEAMAILAVKAERPDFKIYVVDGIEFLPEQLAFNLMDDAPSFGPVDKWTAYVEGGWRERETIFNSMANMSVAVHETGKVRSNHLCVTYTLSILCCS